MGAVHASCQVLKLQIKCLQEKKRKKRIKDTEESNALNIQ